MKKKNSLVSILVVLFVFASIFTSMANTIIAPTKKAAENSTTKETESQDFTNAGPAVQQLVPELHIAIDKNPQTTLKLQSNQVQWIYDQAENKYRLSYMSSTGAPVFATNVFVQIEDKGTNYYFDGSGHMYTGLLFTPRGTVYMFDDTKNKNEGNMWRGWKNVGNKWFYFGDDGARLFNCRTYDGYWLNYDGSWDGKGPKDAQNIQTNNKKENVASDKSVIYAGN